MELRQGMHEISSYRKELLPMQLSESTTVSVRLTCGRPTPKPSHYWCFSSSVSDLINAFGHDHIM